MKNQPNIPPIFLLTATSVALFSCGCILSKMYQKPKFVPDYLIVLGARVKGKEPGAILKSRIEGARIYLLTHPNTIAVLSGGCIRDAEISEAECMYRALIAEGIPPHRMILETSARTTEENLCFSLALIPENKTVGILTNDFHLFRANRHAKRRSLHASLHGVPSPKEGFTYAFLREILAVIVEGALFKL